MAYLSNTGIIAFNFRLRVRATRPLAGRAGAQLAERCFVSNLAERGGDELRAAHETAGSTRANGAVAATRRKRGGCQETQAWWRSWVEVAVDGGGQGQLIGRMVSLEKTISVAPEDAANLRATARRLGQACAADRVILFGSRASGRASVDSDVDLALVLPDAANARATLRAAHRLLWPRKFPVDLVALSATVWAHKSTLLAREIEAQGIVLYERGAA